jgi:hypothetical protein
VASGRRSFVRGLLGRPGQTLGQAADAAEWTPRRIAVSFCNQPQAPPQLGLIDAQRLRFDAATFGGLEACAGVTGMAVADDFLFLAVQDPSRMARSSLVALERATLEVAAVTHLASALDVHSIRATTEAVYVVSTGTDELLALELNGPEVVRETVAWRPKTAGPREDKHHLNGITEFDGRLVVSGFGRKEGELWTSAHKGFIWDVTNDVAAAEPIYHPHSLATVDGTLAWCASAERRVELLDGRRSKPLDGYVRGLCESEGFLFVATSKGRQVSKSTGAFTALGRPGADLGTCHVTALDLKRLRERATVDIGDEFSEIYDLLPIELEAPVLERIEARERLRSLDDPLAVPT